LAGKIGAAVVVGGSVGASLVDDNVGAFVVEVRVVYISGGGAKSGLIQTDATGCDVDKGYSNQK
jgi:hypothetical protein